MLAKKTSKNQVTLPKEIAKEFPDIEYFEILVEGKKILLSPVRITPADKGLEGIRDKMGKLGITDRDVSKAVKWARKKKR